MKKALCIILAVILLSALVGGCIYVMDTESGLLLAAVGTDPVNSLTLKCAEEGFYLVAGSRANDLWYQWYRDGHALGDPSNVWLDYGESQWVTLYPPISPDGPLLPPLTTPGVYSIRVWAEGTEGSKELSVVVPSCGEGSMRTDVSVVIYGGWDGIPVKAYVGGTEQETLYTARDSSGEPAVLWTFYPPAGEAWSVTVEPQTPPGMDPARWQYKLLRIEGPTPEQVVENPAGSGVSITSAGQYKLHFQLVDMGPQAGQ